MLPLPLCAVAVARTGGVVSLFVNATVAVGVSGLPLTVPVIVALPAAEGAVRTAVYVPSPWSVACAGDTGARVPVPPDAIERSTVAPPVVMLLPYASLRVTVIVEWLEPSATIVLGKAAIVELPPAPAPAVTVSEATDVWPLTVAVTACRPVTVAEHDDVALTQAPSGTIPKVAVCAPRLWPYASEPVTP